MCAAALLFALSVCFTKKVVSKYGAMLYMGIHAVSVGETIAALTFIKEWQKRFPNDNLVFTCSTSTAYHTAEAKLPLRLPMPGISKTRSMMTEPANMIVRTPPNPVAIGIIALRRTWPHRTRDVLPPFA